jgi:hypothetical protein
MRAGPLLCKRLGPMTNVHRLLLAATILTSSLAACGSAPNPEPAPAPRVYTPRAATPDEETMLIRADSEIFAAVVRAQLHAGTDEYPFRIRELRYDPRPYGTRNGYPEMPAGVQGVAPELYFAKAGGSAIDRIAENRKVILELNNVPAGSPFNYPQCAGRQVPTPPPPRGKSATRAKSSDVHSGCPKKPESYLTVGLPLRGQPEGLKHIPNTQGENVEFDGDVWTVLVDEFSTGPGGWRRLQHAWIFKRSRWNRRLELAATIQTAVIE